MKCPKCERKLKKVFHGASDEMAIESLNGEIILGNCCESEYKASTTTTARIATSSFNYNPKTSLSGFEFLNRLMFMSLPYVNFRRPAWIDFKSSSEKPSR